MGTGVILWAEVQTGVVGRVDGLVLVRRARVEEEDERQKTGLGCTWTQDPCQA